METSKMERCAKDYSFYANLLQRCPKLECLANELLWHDWHGELSLGNTWHESQICLTAERSLELERDQLLKVWSWELGILLLKEYSNEEQNKLPAFEAVIVPYNATENIEGFKQ